MKFEYLTIEVPVIGSGADQILDDLNEKGSDGWELITTLPCMDVEVDDRGSTTKLTILVFKRPLK